MRQKEIKIGFCPKADSLTDLPFLQTSKESGFVSL